LSGVGSLIESIQKIPGISSILGGGATSGGGLVSPSIGSTLTNAAGSLGLIPELSAAASLGGGAVGAASPLIGLTGPELFTGFGTGTAGTFGGAGAATGAGSGLSSFLGGAGAGILPVAAMAALYFSKTRRSPEKLRQRQMWKDMEAQWNSGKNRNADGTMNFNLNGETLQLDFSDWSKDIWSDEAFKGIAIANKPGQRILQNAQGTGWDILSDEAAGKGGRFTGRPGRPGEILSSMGNQNGTELLSAGLQPGANEEYFTEQPGVFASGSGANDATPILPGSVKPSDWNTGLYGYYKAASGTDSSAEGYTGASFSPIVNPNDTYSYSYFQDREGN
jgi:hypothetical protein